MSCFVPLRPGIIINNVSPFSLRCPGLDKLYDHTVNNYMRLNLIIKLLQVKHYGNLVSGKLVPIGVEKEQIP